MRRFVTTIIILILSIFLAISFNNEANSFSPGYDDYHIIQSYETVYDDDCKNIQIRIVDNKEVKVCVISTSDPEVGIITEGINNQTIGVSFNNDLSMTRVYMDYSPFKCDSVCLYLNQIDTLIRLENVNGGNWYSLVYYKNFVKNLKLSNTNGENIFDYTNKNREIIRPYPTSNGFSVDPKAFAVSNNGRWLVVEYLNVGIVRYDLVEGTFLRILPDFVNHSWGLMGHSEFAISNDGASVVQMGLNVGVHIHAIDDDCGDKNLDGSVLSNPCPTQVLNTDRIIWSLRYGVKPVFTESGSLKFIAISTDYGHPHIQVTINDIDITESNLDILSLGDSYTSGEGESDDSFYYPNTNTNYEKCHLSKRSYPYLLGSSLELNNGKVRSVACSGAIMEDVLGHDKYLGQRDRLKGLMDTGMSEVELKSKAIEEFLPGRIEQARFVGLNRPKVVTIGIGGNDSGLISKLSHCALPGTCKWVSEPKYRKALGKEIQSLYGKLNKTYSRLMQLSPLSDIYAIGYPQIISDKEYCSGVVGLMFNQEERHFINESIHLLNTVIKTSALNSGIKYLNIEDVFNNHSLCSSTKNPAMNSIRGGDDIDILNIGKYIGNESFHPTPYGHELIAESLKNQINDLKGLTNNNSNNNLEDMPLLSEYWKQGDSDVRLEYKDMLFNNSSQIKTDINTFAPDTTIEIVLTNLEKDEEIYKFNIKSNEKGEVIISKNTLPNILPNVLYSLEVSGENRNGEESVLYDVAFNNRSVEKVKEENGFSISNKIYPQLNSNKLDHNFSILKDKKSYIFGLLLSAPLTIDSYNIDKSKEANLFTRVASNTKNNTIPQIVTTNTKKHSPLILFSTVLFVISWGCVIGKIYFKFKKSK